MINLDRGWAAGHLIFRFLYIFQWVSQCLQRPCFFSITESRQKCGPKSCVGEPFLTVCVSEVSATKSYQRCMTEC